MKKKYIIKPEDNVVVAIGEEDYIKNIDSEMKRYCDSMTFALLQDLAAISAFNIYNHSFKSVAKCDEYDEFNEKIGKEIAGGKADIKYHRAMANEYKKMIKVLEMAIEEVENLYNMHETKKANIEKSIEKYVKKD